MNYTDLKKSVFLLFGLITLQKKKEQVAVQSYRIKVTE